MRIEVAVTRTFDRRKDLTPKCRISSKKTSAYIFSPTAARQGFFRLLNCESSGIITGTNCCQNNNSIEVNMKQKDFTCVRNSRGQAKDTS